MLACVIPFATHAQVIGAAAAIRNPKSETRNPDADATIVVSNKHDSDSAGLARFYAEKRGIPNERIVGLKCPVQEEISRADYDGTIAEPLRELFTKNGWWDLRAEDHPNGRVERNRIRFIALIRGIPLKIAPGGESVGDRPAGPPEAANHNEAAVDSELVTLGAFNRQISGVRQNEYFRSYARILDANFPQLMLVCRLDAPTPEMVRRMITDSLAAEREGLRGFAYIDARNIARNIQQAGYAEGDKWLYAAAADCRKHGIPAILDNGEGLFPEAYPMSRAALYYGWYAFSVAGPFARPDFRFPRGAIAVHIHSFSAATLRNPAGNWCAPLIAAGAAATVGNVNEPFLTFTPQLDILNERLLSGFTFAESAWMSERVTSWQTTMVGDPLYRPFKFLQDADGKPASGEWEAYRAGAKLWFEKDRGSAETALRAAGRRLKSGVIWEGLGLLELTVNGAQEDALAAFREARKAYTAPDDIVRAAIHEVIILRNQRKDMDAVVLAGKLADTYKKSRAVEVLKMLTAR